VNPSTGLLGALQFLTRAPIRLPEPVSHARVVPWFPIAGVLVGLAVGAVAAAAALVLDPLVAAALSVIAGLLITGAFHEDGLADVADAFGGGWNTEQRLDILKDSRHGTYAVAAMISSILLRVVALASLTNPSTMLAGAVAAHTLARGAAVGAIVFFPPAVDSGLGAGAARELRPLPTLAGIAAGATVAAAAIGWWAGPAAAAALGAMVVVGLLAMRKIGGIAGDVLGAVEQVAECSVLVSVAVLAARWDLWWG
jgi:adenosylcobinamide-GDP ribazoletransferase